MRIPLSILWIFFAGYSFAQVCPIIEKRNNGNGQANNCAGANGTPMASNFIGTEYATSFTGLTKTGDIKFRFDGQVNNPPAIKRIWIGSTLSTAVVGPASVPVFTDTYTAVTYCFYNVNLPTVGSYTLEFVNPQTDSIMSLCGFSGSSSEPITPPAITTQPQSQTACLGGIATFSVSAQPTYGGSLVYQWRKSGVDIEGATSSKISLTGLTANDAGDYDCRVGETTGTFTISSSATLSIISCASNTYMDPCGSGSLISANTDSWNSAWADYDNDGWEDIFITEKSFDHPNKLFRNTGGGFSETAQNTLTASATAAAASTWADMDNDGDLDVLIVNATRHKSQLYENNGNGTFTALTSSGIDSDPQYFHGAAWSDFDNDGYVDLIITNFFETRFHFLYKNNGNKTFTRILNTPITAESNRSVAPILCDYNNDGLTDVFIPNGSNKPNSLFKNLGNFNFEKITTGDIATDAYNSVGACWGDYDGDGWVDLFVANASNQNNNLYHNNGDGTFTKITSSIVANELGHSHGANFIDIDNDQDLDLLVTNDEGPNFLYTNDGAGNFTRIIEEAIATDIGLSYGQAWADYNKDGMLDVMITTHSNQPDKLFCGKQNANHWINIKLEGTFSNRSGIGAHVKVKTGGIWQVRQVNAISGFGSQNSLRQHVGLGNYPTIDSIEVRWPSGYRQYLTNIAADRFITITEESGNVVSLLTFHDENGNCTKDENENIVSGITLALNNGSIRTATNEAGVAELNLRTDSYSVNVQNNNHWSLGCTVNFTTPANPAEIQIPLNKTDSQTDLSISIGSTAWRRGFTNQTIVQIKNLSATRAENLQVSLQYPQEVVVKTSNPGLAYAGNNLYTIQLTALDPGQWTNIHIEDSVTLQATLGDNLTLQATVTSDGTDADLSNNTVSLQNEIVGAIDPNDMLVSPRGIGYEGFVAKHERLTYTIRFQNVGTFNATFIKLENTIPENLDLQTFTLESSSHVCSFSINERRQLIVKYSAINLPTSDANETESHGFFTYSMVPATNCVAGDVIRNSARIFFDYEDPLTTNEVVNTIIGNRSNGQTLVVFPNPASDAVTLLPFDDENGKIKSLRILNSQGHVESAISIDDTQTVPVAGLKPGLYILEAMTDANEIRFGKLVIR